MNPAPGPTTCPACGRLIPVKRSGRDWCGKACRTALRRLGSVLEPTADRDVQLATALEHQRTAVDLRLPNPAAGFLANHYGPP